ncbi:glycoside hydrolase family 15 protein [Jatrophihabitans sp. YIM 134969]
MEHTADRDTGWDPDRALDRHGLIGDTRTTALVSAAGTVDHLCLPDHDSPSVFAALLDPDVGGSLRCDVETDDGPTPTIRHRQAYLPGTNILVTRLQGGGAIVEITDFMLPMHLADGREGVVVRRVRALHGARKVRLTLWPGFDYARADHRTTVRDDDATVEFDAGEHGTLTAHVSGRFRVEDRDRRGSAAVADLELGEDETATMVLHWGDGTTASECLAEADRWLDVTTRYWQDWLDTCTYDGRWRDAVHRSALCLKLLQHAPTGGIVASPTFSLPEWPGADRNWDYRYVWLRDAAFVMFAMLRIGFVDECRAFALWLVQRCQDIVDGAGLHPVYRLDGSPPPEEVELDHLAGFAGSTPVRVGNNAYGQVQLDVLGEVMDALYLYDRVDPISWRLWEALTVQLDWLAEHWEEPDAGIWEVRGERQQFVSSKVLVWVAFERAGRLARRRGLPGEHDRWRDLADRAYRWVQEHGWDEETGAYVQRAGSSDLDSSALLIPMLRFASGNDPRVASTMDVIAERLGTDGLIYRYQTREQDRDASHLDGVGGEEGTFTVSTFWHVENLARAGRVGDARRAFERTLTYAGELALFAEQIGPAGEALGNYPQGLTHLGLISAATTLDRRLHRSSS